MRAWLDRTMGKFASRKLTAWVTATVLLATGDLSMTVWETVTLVYIGTQGATDVAERIMRARRGQGDGESG